MSSFKVTHETPTFRIRERGSAPVMTDWKCAAGHVHFTVAETKPDAPPCETCGEPTTEVVGMPNARIDDDYPRWDQGLGCRLESAAHRKRLMDERGLVSVADVGEFDVDAQARKASERIRREDAEVRDLLIGFEHGPDSAQLKAARDRGEIKDWAPWIASLPGGLDGPR